MRTLTLLIPGDVNELSPNRRLCWQEKARRTKRWKDTARLLWVAGGELWVGDRVVVDVVVRRPRLLDPHNALSSGAISGALNGLKGLAFPDDDARHLRCGTLRQEKSVRCELEITITEEGE